MATIDVSAAFDLLPNTTTVTYGVRVQGFPTQGYTFYPGIKAFATPESLDEIQPSGGYYRRYRKSYKLRLADLTFNGITPVLGDGIIDGKSWIVVRSHKALANWTAGCVAFTIGPDQVDWRQTSQQTNVFGDRITDPNTFPLGGVFPCRVQPADNTILDMFGKRGALQHFVVYLLTDEKFTYGDLFIQTNANNRKFVIRDWRDREDIQNAMMVLCEVLP